MFHSMLALLLLGSPTADERKATLAYLYSLQVAKLGGFRLDADTKEPTLRATSSALRAIKYFGGKAANRAGCSRFVASCRGKSGGFGNVPGGKPDAVLTAVGLMAEVELGVNKASGPSIAYLEENAKEFEQVRMAAAALEAIGKESKKNKEWIEQLIAKRNADGTWGDARDTGGHAVAVLRLGGKVDAAAVVKAMDAGQREDGGFGFADKDGSDLETTYRVLRCYHMLKKKPAKADAVRAFIAKCRNKDGGYGTTPGGPSSVGGTYFAGIVLHWLEEK